MRAVPVCFYLPCTGPQFQRLPRTLADYPAWQTSETELMPFLGRYHWVLQTYLQLRETGAAVELVRELPDAGIVISHVECLDYGLRPSMKTMLVPMLVDKDVPMPHGALHVTHNPVQRLPLGLRQFYMPPWPQIGLVPRSAAREDRFENCGFIGAPDHLHSDLASAAFANRLASLGLRLVIPPPAAWHDFSEIDVVLAVRNFGRNDNHLNRPALKLINAWLAGVPAVLGHESAYRHEGRVDDDYLEATSVDEIFDALRRLAHEPALRARITGAGMRKMRTRNAIELRARWLKFIETQLIPLHTAWTGDRLFRTAFRVAGAARERLLWRKPAWFGEQP